MANAHVYAGIDGSMLSESIVDYASWIANAVSAPITFLHNLETSDAAADSDLSGSIGLGSREQLLDHLIELEANRNRLLIERGKTLLDNAANAAKENKVDEIHTLQRHGLLSETLIDLEQSIRVLVLGIRGEDSEQNEDRLGHQLSAIIRALHKPIFVVNGEFSMPKNLLLAYDGSDAANKALNWITRSPLYKELECHIVHVTKDKDSDKAKTLLAYAQSELSSAGITNHAHILCGDVQENLARYVDFHNIDLLVMGSFGHSKIHDLVLGSFTVKMLRTAKIPLLLLR